MFPCSWVIVPSYINTCIKELEIYMVVCTCHTWIYVSLKCREVATILTAKWRRDMAKVAHEILPFT